VEWLHHVTYFKFRTLPSISKQWPELSNFTTDWMDCNVSSWRSDYRQSAYSTVRRRCCWRKENTQAKKEASYRKRKEASN